MRRCIAAVLSVLFRLLVTGCASDMQDAVIAGTVKTDICSCYEMSDGTWQADGRICRQRIEVRGRLRV